MMEPHDLKSELRAQVIEAFAYDLAHPEKLADSIVQALSPQLDARADVEIAKAQKDVEIIETRKSENSLAVNQVIDQTIDRLMPGIEQIEFLLRALDRRIDALGAISHKHKWQDDNTESIR